MRHPLGPNDLQALTDPGHQQRSALEVLRQTRLAITVPRLSVIQALREAGDEAVTAEDLFKSLLAQGTPVSVATVYRVLKELEHRGTVWRQLRRSAHGAKSVYQLTDQAPASLAEFHCASCGRRITLDAAELALALAPIAQRGGLSLGPGAIHIEATCQGCSLPGPTAAAN
ncbi:transcriptional repressor [Comamonas serinivorans]|nr:transcriptional repressor [Comamonas serinivorans]